MDKVYLNGEFLNVNDAKISIMDRGFLFADGVYEMFPVFDGYLFHWSNYFNRLSNSLAALQIDNPYTQQEWANLITSLVAKNGNGRKAVYLHITRGIDQVRNHDFPASNIKPSILIMTLPLPLTLMEVDEDIQQGIKAVCLEDIRWSLCHIKAVALLPNVLLRRQAQQQGADDAIMVRSGLITEGAASNVFMVTNKVLVTSKNDGKILGGVTRDLIIQLAAQYDVAIEERDITVAELYNADEIWLTSSSKMALPVVEIDGRLVADGKIGPLWRQFSGYYRQYLVDWLNLQKK